MAVCRFSYGGFHSGNDMLGVLFWVYQAGWVRGAVWAVGIALGVLLTITMMLLTCVYCEDVVNPVRFGSRESHHRGLVGTHLVSVHGTRVRCGGVRGIRTTGFSRLDGFLGSRGLPFLVGRNMLASRRLRGNVARGRTIGGNLVEHSAI